MEAIAKQSQVETQHQLELWKAQLVGAEGETLDLFTLEQERDDLVRAARTHAQRYGLPAISDTQAEAFITKRVEKWATLRYLKDHPQTRGVGLEIQCVQQLQTCLEMLSSVAPPEMKKHVHDIYMRVVDVRSDIALARMLHQARLANHPSAALTIGAAHEARLKEIAQLTGLRMRFVLATQLR